MSELQAAEFARNAAWVTLTKKNRWYLHDVMLPPRPSRLTLCKKKQKAGERLIIEHSLPDTSTSSEQ